MSSELKEKTAKGVSWGFVDNFLNYGIVAVANIVLANLLTPSDFGIIGMTALFITLSTSLVDSGFTGALTRKKEVNDADLSTVFYFNFAISLLLYAVLFFTAPLIAAFFEEEILVPVIRILSLSLVVNALGIVHKVLFIRVIDFKTQAKISLFSAVASSLLAIAAAFYGMGVWSLVILQVARAAISTIMLWMMSKWRPGLLFSGKSFKEMFSFGSRLLATSIISAVWSEMYSFIIGKFYTSSTLGLYSHANKTKNMVTSNVSIVMQRVSFPVLSSVQDERLRRVEVYRKVLKTTVLIAFTAVLGLWAVAPNFTAGIFGEQWIPAVGYIRILCFSGLFIPMIMCGANVINSDGRSDITLMLEILKTLLAVIPLLLGIFISIEALLYGMIATHAVLFTLHSLYVAKITGYRFADQIRDILPPLVVAGVMSGLVNLLNLLPLHPLAGLAVQVAAGGAIILSTYEFIYRNSEYCDIKEQLLKAFRKVGKRGHGEGKQAGR